MTMTISQLSSPLPFAIVLPLVCYHLASTAGEQTKSRSDDEACYPRLFDLSSDGERSHSDCRDDQLPRANKDSNGRRPVHHLFFLKVSCRDQQYAAWNYVRNIIPRSKQ